MESRPLRKRTRRPLGLLQGPDRSDPPHRRSRRPTRLAAALAGPPAFSWNGNIDSRGFASSGIDPERGTPHQDFR